MRLQSSPHRLTQTGGLQIARGHFLYVNNMLSLARLLLAPFIFYSIISYERGTTLALGALAVLSDVLDGYAARRLKLPSDLGKIVDPIADKIVIGSALFALVRSKHYEFPMWAYGVVVIRDVLIVLGSIFLAYHIRVVTRSNRWGKCATVFLSVALILYVLNLSKVISFYVLCVGISFIVISSWSYFQRLMRLLQTDASQQKQ